MRRNVVAYLALFVALGGTSYAAAQLPKNSVGTKQIKKNGVRSSDIKKNSVTSSKIKNGTVSADDLAAGLGAKGDTGAQGPQGVKGDKGDKGEPGTPKTFRADGTATNVPAGGTVSASAFCDPGEIAISGGFGNASENVIPTRIQRNLGNERRYDFDFKNTGGAAAIVFPQVICAK